MMNAFLLTFTTFILCFSLFNLQVHGIVRRSSSFNTGRIEHLYKNPQAHIEGSKTFLLYLSFFFPLVCGVCLVEKGHQYQKGNLSFLNLNIVNM